MKGLKRLTMAGSRHTYPRRFRTNSGKESPLRAPFRLRPMDNAARPSEARGGERQAPRRVQLAVLRHADEQIPIRVEGVDEAEALAVELISRARALLRVRHEDSRSDRLNPEGRVSCRNL